jgi:hypothetical protein
MTQKLEVNNYGVGNFNFFFFAFWKLMLQKFKVQNTVMFDRFRVENTCLILDLVTGEAVQTKPGLYFANKYGPEIDEIKIISGSIRVSRPDGNFELAVADESSPVTSLVSSPEPENEEISFLPAALLRPSVHVILDDDSRSPSPVQPSKKGRKWIKVW